MIGEYIDIDAAYSFIGGGIIDPNVVDGVIDFWNDCDYLNKEDGHVGGYTSGVANGPDKKVKESRDLTIPRYIKDPRICRYIDELADVTTAYCENYPVLKNVKWDLVSDFNIQWSPKGGGFHALHCERSDAHPQCCNRMVAWMTYLNDIEEGGETYFKQQECKVRPKKGLTLLWPADWTHFHKGIPAPNEEKMIITGWDDHGI